MASRPDEQLCLCQVAEQVRREYALRSIAGSSVDGKSLLLDRVGSASIASAAKSLSGCSDRGGGGGGRGKEEHRRAAQRRNGRAQVHRGLLKHGAGQEEDVPVDAQLRHQAI